MRNLKSVLSPLFVGALLLTAQSTALSEEDKAKPDTVTMEVTASALEQDPGGWLDLLPGQDLKGWKRVAYPGKTLKEPNIWSVGEDKVLHCEGTGVHENFFYEKDLGDGIFHVEWRFKKIEGATGYNSGVFVRTSEDGQIWHQAQVGNRNVGYIFGASLKDGKSARIKIDDHVSQAGKEAGEWNTYEITCRGREVRLWINGVVTASWKDCEVTSGLLGLEAEGWYIEFRNVKFKALGSQSEKAAP